MCKTNIFNLYFDESFHSSAYLQINRQIKKRVEIHENLR